MKKVFYHKTGDRIFEMYQDSRGFTLKDIQGGVEKRGFLPYRGFRKSSDEFLVEALKWAIDVVEGRKELE